MCKLNLDKRKKYLLACSFGPDSMALFYLLKKEGYQFECAIVNYHLRAESNSEVKGLLDYASKNDVVVHVHECNRSLENLSEAKCREIRYDFFAKLYHEFGYSALLVAHQQDDLIETYLIQKQRQNCPEFYGIREKTRIKGMEVMRPLLSFSKKELEQICIDNNVPYAIDKSNFDVSFLRNKIRHEVVGKMDELDRELILSELALENVKLTKILTSIDVSKIHNVDYLNSLEEIELKYALNILVKFIDDSYFLSKQNVGEIKKTLLSDKPNISFKIKRGLYFYKEYDKIDISNTEESFAGYKYVLDEPGELDTPYFYLNFTHGGEDRNVHEDSYPILIRNISLNDYIYINGYRAYAKRLFIDWKMPLRLRLKWPVIVDKKGRVIYIPRYKKSFKLSDDLDFFVKL